MDPAETVGTVMGTVIGALICAVPAVLLLRLLARQYVALRHDLVYRPTHLRAPRPVNRPAGTREEGHPMAISEHMPQPSRWSRKRKVMSATAGVVLAGLVSFAVALWLVRGPIGGGGQVDPSQPQALQVTAMAVLDPDSSSACSASASNGAGSITFSGARNATCVVDVTVQHPQGQTYGLKLSDVHWADDFVDSFIAADGSPGGLTCGTPLANGVARSFALHLRIRPDAPIAGASFTANANTDGVFASDDASSCPTAF